ncbi:unnamed protein product [Calypogeia fissa]
MALKRMQPTLSTKMHSLTRATSLSVLLGVTMLGQLVSGENATSLGCLASGLESTGSDTTFCTTCSSCSGYQTQNFFTVRNDLPQGDSNLYAKCYYFDDCWGLTVEIEEFPCRSATFPANLNRSPVQPSVQQILCEFTWTRTNANAYYRALVLVWSNESNAPKTTYYRVDSTGFWFANSTDGTLSSIGNWGPNKPLQILPALKGAANSVYLGFNRLHCHTSA